LKILLFDWQDAKKYAEPIRQKVFIEEQQVPESMEWDEYDNEGVHALAFVDERHAVGYARLLNSKQLGRMAVMPGFRHRGIGSALLLRLEEAAKERRFDHIFLHAQIQALPFYERLGYVTRGEPFEEAGIPHLMMIKTLEDNNDR
jgi:predicted GNAT family N-acyltransferase